MKRVMVYIDGFNLYFGMMAKNLDHLKWLDLQLLSHNLLKDDQYLVEVKYFTSRVRNNPPKERRQTIYIEALETMGISIFFGQYQPNIVQCNRCGNIWSDPNEKMTDVNIATQMIVDAHLDKFDTALLISGDSDLVPPIKAIKVHFDHKTKRIVVAFPPKRYTISVKSEADSAFIIGKKKIKDSQLPKEIKKPDGYILKKPEEWS